jgi:Na+-transporting methylmalonyl-CoA/oxaloacetate decarboxylase beta subunit
VFHEGLASEIIPVFIFLGLGAMTDFGPIIANPKTLILGAGAQFGVYFAFFCALLIGSILPADIAHIGINEACSIGIIGGADGPTTIYLTTGSPRFPCATQWRLYVHGTRSYYPAPIIRLQPPRRNARST